MADDRTSIETGASTGGQRVVLLGATGTIGRAVLRALLARGHAVTCFVRPAADSGAIEAAARDGRVVIRRCDVGDPASILTEGFRGEPFDAVLSCMASRSGAPDDAWAIDHRAHCNVLEAAQAAGVRHFVLLSAICVQRPQLAFQHAKLAFEAALMDSGLTWSIVRPTAFFKSLSGQVARLQAGKPFLMFGDGTLTACKPISDADLADYLADCLTDPARRDRILPIGGPGPAISPRDQAAMLFALSGQPARVRRVPIGLLDAIVAVLALAGRFVPAAARKAELARIGRYYATESMLLWDAEAGRYSAEATPSTGSDTLAAHYRALIAGEVADDRGEHAVF